MAIDYTQLIDKLGSKLNTVGEAAFKIGVTGAKFEAIGEFTAAATGAVLCAGLAYSSWRRSQDDDLSYDEQGFFGGAAIFMSALGVVMSGLTLLHIPSILIALNQPEYLFLRSVIKTVK